MSYVFICLSIYLSEVACGEVSSRSMEYNYDVVKSVLADDRSFIIHFYFKTTNLYSLICAVDRYLAI